MPHLEISPQLALVLVVTVAYLATHLLFDRIARRFLVVSGAEYVVLGVLLGPLVAGVLSDAVLASLAPLTTLALGWVGAIIGMQFHLPTLVRVPGLHYRLGFAQSLATLGLVAGVEVLVLHGLGGLPLPEATAAGVALGAIAAASTPAGIAIAARAFGQRGPVVRQLEIATAVDAFVAVSAFGLLLCVTHTAPVRTSRAPTATEWAVINLGVGVVAGALFHLFIGSEQKVDRLVVSLLGAVVLASGAAAYLELSPLLTTMIVGIILVNTSKNRDEITTVLARGERPFYYVLLVFAGAAWQPSGLRGWPLAVLLFLAVRALAKVGGAAAATRLSGAEPALGTQWGRALLGQGGLAVAVALDYLRRDNPPVPSVVFTATIASVLLTDLSSPRLVRSVLAPVLDPFVRGGLRLPRWPSPTPADPPLAAGPDDAGGVPGGSLPNDGGGRPAGTGAPGTGSGR